MKTRSTKANYLSANVSRMVRFFCVVLSCPAGAGNFGSFVVVLLILSLGLQGSVVTESGGVRTRRLRLLLWQTSRSIQGSTETSHRAAGLPSPLRRSVPLWYQMKLSCSLSQKRMTSNCSVHFPTYAIRVGWMDSLPLWWIRFGIMVIDFMMLLDGCFSSRSRMANE